MIPLIIHQTWKDFNLPPAFARWSADWRRLHPDFDYRLHTDMDNLQLVIEHYPNWLDMYRSFPHNIQRVDMARVMWLHHSAGIYVDMDIEPLKSVIPLMERETLFTEPVTEEFPTVRRPIICNYAMVAERGSPFMYELLLWMKKDYDYRGKYLAEAVCETTGPLRVSEVFRHLLNRQSPALPRVMGDLWCLRNSGSYGHHHFASTWHKKPKETT